MSWTGSFNPEQRMPSVLGPQSPDPQNAEPGSCLPSLLKGSTQARSMFSAGWGWSRGMRSVQRHRTEVADGLLSQGHADGTQDSQ